MTGFSPGTVGLEVQALPGSVVVGLGKTGHVGRPPMRMAPQRQQEEVLVAALWLLLLPRSRVVGLRLVTWQLTQLR